METALNAQQVCATIGPDQDVIRAMIQAERYGQGAAHGATVICSGYLPRTQEFNAATALYSVRW